MSAEVSAMTIAVDAIYEDGVLKPEQPLDLKEKTKVRLVIETTAKPTAEDDDPIVRESLALGFEPLAQSVTACGGGREARLVVAEKRFDLVVVDPFTMDGVPVKSTDIRAAIERGDLAKAERLLGRPVGVRGDVDDGVLTFDWPMALPPAGRYPATIDGRPGSVAVEDRAIRIPPGPSGTVRVEFAG